MRELPILFSAPMVRAILDGRKTQTRRIVRPDWWRCLDPDDVDDRARAVDQSPYGRPGDRLWVRETWTRWDGGEHARRDGTGVSFRADCLDARGREDSRARLDYGIRWYPSIHMRRADARILLEVKAVRVERLTAITPADAIAEGAFGDGRYATAPGTPYPVATFAELWDSINGDRAPFASDPWVWVVTFRRVAP